MNSLEANTKREIFTYGLAGILLGICLVSILTLSLIFIELASIQSEPLPTATILPQSTPNFSHSDLLGQARDALDNSDPQAALDLLKPHLDEFTELGELETALEYLGQAEYDLGHYQLAAVYLDRLCQVSPGGRHYMMLATAYDLGGDMERALANYLLAIKAEDSEFPVELRQVAKERADQLQDILTDPTPMPTSK